MKIISWILGLGFLIITACILYVIKSGVSIRTAPMIKPAAVSADFTNVPQSLFLRLFPDLQQSHYILWGVSQNSSEVQKTLSILKDRYELEFKKPVHFIYDGLAATLSDVEKCPHPCWILFPEEQAHELNANSWQQKNLHPLQRTYFTLTWISYERNLQVQEHCVAEQRLDLECLKQVSVNEVRRKMPEPRSFFMRKYMDRDYFLLVETAQ